MEEEPVYVLPHDTANAFVLPPRKKKAKKEGNDKIKESKQKAAISKKKQKKLKKLLEKRKKKAECADIFERLKRCQIEPSEMLLMTSVAKMQQKDPKRLPIVPEAPVCKSIAGSRKGMLSREQAFERSTPYFETDSSSGSDEEDADDKVPEISNGNNPSLIQSDPLQSASCSNEPAKEKLFESTIPKPETACTTAVDSKVISCPAVHVPVFRSDEIEKGRLKLPVVAEEQAIIEAIKENQVVIVCGETGSGKSTQVPQFLYEAGFTTAGKMIGVTEPRRVAAINISHRVADEMNLSRDVVSYQIRFEGNVTEKTKIKFMTDGVLLKEIQKDFLLSSYSAILIDEAHERSMYSDVLIGLLSRIILIRERRQDKLHLVIMSATLRVEDFLMPKLFKQTPTVIKVDSRQYPVTAYFSRHTMHDYLQAAYRKVCQVHRLLPRGSILVFVSGQKEVHTLLSWLKKRFPLNAKASEPKPDKKSLGKRKKKLVNLDDYKEDSLHIFEEVDLNDQDAPDLDIFDVEELECPDIPTASLEPDEPLFCLPLYSLMPSGKQARVFQEPPAGYRCCVIATNVAETSVTIPNVRYVIDTGKEKVRLYDPVTGISKFVVQWISKASASQRAGRAGRLGPGHCYRLYSSAVYNDFEKYSRPEILTEPLDDLVLQMKAMCILKVCNFPFPTALDVDSLRCAEERLVKLGLLENALDSNGRQVARITKLGRTVALLPLAPRYGKMVALACQQGLLAYAICLVSALSVREPLLNPSTIECKDIEKKKEKIAECLRSRRALAGQGHSLLLGDLMVLLKASLAAEQELTVSFCEKHGFRYKAMVEICKMRRQLTKIVNALCTEADLAIGTQLKPPTDEQAELLRQLVLTGLCENVARRADDCFAQTGCKPSRLAYRSAAVEDPLWIHPTSVLFRAQPEWLVYQEIVDSNGKKCMLNVMAIESEWLVALARGCCSMGEPLKEPAPFYSETKDQIVCHVDCTYGLAAWPLPRQEVAHPVDIMYYRYFASEFLEGRVISKLAKYRSSLITPPSILFKPWARLQSKTGSLLGVLVSNEVTSKEALIRFWKEKPNFLCNEYLEWVAQSKHNDVLFDWPPLEK
ncbi:ATP dependent RNA helicase DHX37 [Trichuris trichiura]|uniref:RNA helicase n=1 Tax=Trichuris trichiura TaxID=36087 RepID=A0A077Z877_TRITR|nr:ATP dependent RNA helicase DHX37 [Trichuris trichiura]